MSDSKRDTKSSETSRQRPGSVREPDAKIKSELHGDMQRVAEMPTPDPHRLDSTVRKVAVTT